MGEITTPSRVALAMLASAMTIAGAWALDDRLPSDYDVMPADVTCITDARLRDGIVLREIEDGGPRFAWRIDQDGQERIWKRVSGEQVDWCTSGEPVFLHGHGRPTH